LAEVIYGALLGLLAGLAFQRITVFQIKKRTEESSKVEAVNAPMAIVLWMIVSALLFGIIFYIESESIVRLQSVLIMSIAISISVVDIDIRRIPNESVLALLLVRAIGIIADISDGQNFLEAAIPSFIGMAVGFLIYSIPSMIGVPIGAGDTKYSAAIGFCLGFYGFLEASIIMSIALFVYWVYLKGTGKGTAKTVTMQGPYLSLGVMVTLIFPYERIIELFAK